MIIKYFCRDKKKRSVGDDKGGDGGIDQSKIQFINLVGPLTNIIVKQNEYGPKMIALSVMAICNMCDYSEDIKDIFLYGNGH